MQLSLRSPAVEVAGFQEKNVVQQDREGAVDLQCLVHERHGVDRRLDRKCGPSQDRLGWLLDLAGQPVKKIMFNFLRNLSSSK